MKHKYLTFILVFSIVVITMVTSCVSKKKYDEVVQEIARMKVDSTYSDYYLAKAKYDKNEVIYDLKDSIIAKARKLDSLEAVLANQEEQLDLTFKTLDNMNSTELEVTNVKGKILLNIDDNILFESNSDDISDSGKKVISEISAAISDLEEGVEIWVVGHTDSRPFTEGEVSNWELSTHRALSVVELLVENRIDPKKLIAAGRSKFDPILTNRTFEGRMMNRRTEIMIVPTVPLD